MRNIGLCLLASSALLCSACGSSSTSSTGVTPSGTATSGPATTSESNSVPAPPQAARPAPGRCTASVLALSFLGQQGATGHGELGLALRNTSSSSCRTFGYPGVQFLDQAGKPLPTASTRTSHDFFGAAPTVSLVLAPGQSASFRLGVTHGINSSAGCVNAAGLQVIPPDDTGTLRVTIPQGAAECGTTTVSPLRPATSAYP